MPARQELFAEVPRASGFGTRRVPGEDTGDTVEVAPDRNRPQPAVGEAYKANVTVPLFDSTGNPTGTERTLLVTGHSSRHVIRRANERLAQMGSPYLVGSAPRPDSTGYPILKRRSAK